ncbi:gluconolactonase-like [Bradysia coprophila]|uniref:gluconolactonase-like n=1 Tax=Bradysia coprophila TaxID=38358 RepID=UPI00187DBF09|nr:gluconolactonase-like [Bradysia coprophila]
MKTVEVIAGIVIAINILIPPHLCCDLVPNFDGSCWDLVSQPFITYDESKFGPLIEGAGVNPTGDIFAVDYGSSKTTFQLGQVSPSQKLFYRDGNESSLLNGIRFLNSKVAFVADAVNHRVLKLTLNERDQLRNENYCSDSRMIQPNDITLSSDGTIFTSGMKWLPDTNSSNGDIWSCRPDGTVQRLEVLGRTNGIDLSPDEKTLYVSESFNRGGTPYIQRIWKYNVDTAAGTTSNKLLFADFDSLDGSVTSDIDGMKTDTDGNLFVARYGGRHIAILSPATGKIVGKIQVSFPNPTNLEFGGTDGRTLFIVGQCRREGRGCVDRIEMVTPGRTWSMLQ